ASLCSSFTSLHPATSIFLFSFCQHSSPVSFLFIFPRPPASTLFPYTTLFRSHQIPARHGPGLDHRRDEGLRPARPRRPEPFISRSEEHTSELQSRFDLVCRLLLEKKY